MSEYVHNMNDAVLDLTKRAFETMGFKMYDQNGLHCNSLKHLIIAPNVIVKNLKPPSLLPVSDATLRDMFDIPDYEEGDLYKSNMARISCVQLQIKSLMEIVHHFEEELVSENPYAAFEMHTKEQIKNQECVVLKISKSSQREHNTIRRNLSKQQKTATSNNPTQSVEISNPTKDELLATKRQDAMREFQLLVQLVKYIITELVSTELVNKQNVIASLRTIRHSYERSEERQKPIANQISVVNSSQIHHSQIAATSKNQGNSMSSTEQSENSHVASTSKKPRKNEENNTEEFHLF
ncbi:uncharacterized protein LOC128273118 [Anopheles cruzii]|uniref:uncharacterized protein LOC128273118 n=1 Tax=Anopheles cruzii TaxID=68878 RepID=UPI0022EC3E86|nr:uncharacterized protein LOC128273118 [Anopheles cruzii]